ncbi:hypothetical protein VNO78_18182 [Psophocarpus tetragonolobus]|uniref:Pectinesterase n=1 Tax=Psophocarpus tetragonolobus TaxID=3891 RepID=A0AAN9XLT9_PSOTE
MSGKVIISAVSLILVVGVAIGVVVAVNKKGDDPSLEAHQKSVGVVCQNTDEQKLCHDTLSSVKGIDTADPKAYIATAVKATMDSVIKAFNMSDRLTTEHGSSDNGTKMALDDCKDLLQSAIQSLQLSTDMVQNNNIQAVHNQQADFKNWLSAVISYQQACMEGFDDDKDGEKKIKDQLHTESLDSVEKLTGITLDIVSGLSHILEQFGLKFNLKPASRRLLTKEGYPTWFSAADRKLLGQLQGKGWRAHVTPNVVVAQDGSGQFKTVADAIASYPANNQGRYIIYVKAGIYDEYITVPHSAKNILLYGDGPAKTIITGRKNFVDGVKTMQTATFANTADGFIAKALTFQNTAGAEGHQAVAFRNQGDTSAVVGCHILGYQDTLYVQTNRQFYRNCVISGTIDFIFGTSATVIQHSVIIVRKPLDNQLNTVTADGTSQKNMATGIVIQDCSIVPEQELFPLRFQIKSFLGRPWKQYSRTVVMESTIGDFLHPEGWCPWAGEHFEDTLYYAEYNNDGPGANVSGRIKWKGYRGLISREEANRFTAAEFLKAGPNAGTDWLKALHVPHALSLTKA